MHEWGRTNLTGLNSRHSQSTTPCHSGNNAVFLPPEARIDGWVPSLLRLIASCATATAPPQRTPAAARRHPSLPPLAACSCAFAHTRRRPCFSRFLISHLCAAPYTHPRQLHRPVPSARRARRVSPHRKRSPPCGTQYRRRRQPRATRGCPNAAAPQFPTIAPDPGLVVFDLWRAVTTVHGEEQTLQG